MKNFDKTELFEKEIEPLINELHKKCKEHDLPLVCSVIYALENDELAIMRNLYGEGYILTHAVFEILKELSTEIEEKASDLQ